MVTHKLHYVTELEGAVRLLVQSGNALLEAVKKPWVAQNFGTFLSRWSILVLSRRIFLGEDIYLVR